MLIIKTIVLLCLTKYGYSLQYQRALQDIDAHVSRCADRVAECYYIQPKGKRGDVFKCLKYESKEE